MLAENSISSATENSPKRSTCANSADSLNVRGLVLLIAAYAAIWFAAHPYEGIVFDAHLYALQALATIHPIPLADDIFLRYGSQDDFTLFPRILSLLIEHLGLEPAAAVATLTCYLLLLVAGWLLARHLSSPRAAWLAVGLLISIPGWYGAGEVFRYDELYLNARLGAEAVSLLGILAALRGRWWTAAAIAIFAALIHPLMATPAFALIMALRVYRDRWPPELLPRATVAVAILTVTAVLMTKTLDVSQDPKHELWIEVLRSRSRILFLDLWRAQDWFQNALGMLSLALTASALRKGDVTRFAYLAVMIGLLGITAAAIASAFPSLKLLLLAQPWRWVWISRVMAVLLLPLTFETLWRRGPAGRSTSLMLASSWVLFDSFGGVLALIACLAWFIRGHLNVRAHTVMLYGAWAIACLGILSVVVLGVQAWQPIIDFGRSAPWVQSILNVAGLAGVPVLVAAVAWLVASLRGGNAVQVSLTLLFAIGLVGLVPDGWQRWTDEKYSGPRHDSFSGWRQRIPIEAEVFWHADPVAVWALLERKSYLSGSQSAGLLYSPNAVEEFLKRGESLSSLASPGWWVATRLEAEDAPKKLSRQILRDICQHDDLGYVVDSQDLKLNAPAVVWPVDGLHVYLYECADFRAHTKP